MVELAGGTRAPPGTGIRRPGRRVLVLAAALLLAALGGAYLWLRAARPAVRYTTATVERGAVAQAVQSTGTVNPVTTIQVGTYVSGVIQSIGCDFNTRVTAGQLCAKIDPRPYQSAVDQAAAALATARAQLDKDRANLDYATLIDARNRGLLARGIVSQETADTSHNALAQARAQVAYDGAEVAQRRAQWQAARINLGYTDIVAPVDGGTLAAQRDAAIQAYAVQLGNYRQALLHVFGRVADGLAALAHDAALDAAATGALDSARAALALTQESYRAGQASLPQLLEAQRLYQQARLGAARAAGQRHADTAQLFVALGGVSPAAPDAGEFACAGRG